MKKYTDAQLGELGLLPALPAHVAMIMDGNGRWAKKRGMPRSLGHRAGMERLRGLIRLSSDIGIRALSLYAFSTENWKRPEEEKNALFGLLIEYFNKEIEELHQNEVCIRALGDITPFPKQVSQAIRAAEEKTAQNKGLKLSIALNYGGQDELLRMTKKVAARAQAGELPPEKITKEYMEGLLDTQGLPPVDFLIRTAGEQRISNFLLYQIAYAEFLFVDEYWPDFSDERYVEALKQYQSRFRRFGGL